MEQKVTIELDVVKWNVVLKGVVQLPFVEVAELVAEIKAQADKQLLPQNVNIQTAEVQPS